MDETIMLVASELTLLRDALARAMRKTAEFAVAWLTGTVD
jgi:hypothetical protein